MLPIQLVTRRVILGLIFLVGAALGPAPAWAGPGDGVVIDVSGAKRGAYPIAVPVGVASDPAAAKVVADVTSFDLGVAGLFKVLDPASFLADLGAEQLGLDPQKWKDVGAYGVIKYRVTTTGDAVDIEFRLYEVSKGGTAQLSKTYRGKKAELRRLVHAGCN